MAKEKMTPDVSVDVTADIVPEVKEEKVLTAEAPEAPEAPKVPEVKASPVAKEVILARAVGFLAFKVLEPNEFAEFKMRYPELF